MRIPKTAPDNAVFFAMNIRPGITKKAINDMLRDLKCDYRAGGKGAFEWVWINNNRTDDAIAMLTLIFRDSVGSKLPIRMVITTGDCRPADEWITFAITHPFNVESAIRHNTTKHDMVQAVLDEIVYLVGYANGKS